MLVPVVHAGRRASTVGSDDTVRTLHEPDRVCAHRFIINDTMPIPLQVGCIVDSPFFGTTLYTKDVSNQYT